MQNLENIGVSADSTSHCGNRASAWRRVEVPLVLVRLSKIDDYLVDNISGCRLSQLGHAVNDKARGGTQAFENKPAWRVSSGPG